MEFWWCLKRAQMCTFGVLGLSCASPGGPVWWGRRGFTRQPESPNVHIGLQKHHQNSTRRHPERHKKNETVAGKGRKRAKFWAVQGKGGPGEGGPAEGGPAEGGPAEGGPAEGGPAESKPTTTKQQQRQQTQNDNKHKTTTQQHNNTTTTTKIGQNTKTLKLAKVGLASPTLAKPTMAKPTLAKPTLANVKVLVVCKDFVFSELIVWVF